MQEPLPLLGCGLPVSGSWATAATMGRMAQRCEDLGYQSLWTFQRLLVPATDGGAEWPPIKNPGSRTIDDPAYQSVHDAVLPLAYVAAQTSRIRLGTATLCALFTPPVLLAKALATLDHLSGGRLEVGMGLGWLPQEYAAAGVPWERRGARFEEYLEVLRLLWTQDTAQHSGEFYTIPPCSLGVRPVQRPGPPLLLGGVAAPALHRAGRLADGWIASSRQDLDQIGSSITKVRTAALAAGRDPGSVRVVVRGLVDLRPTPAPRGRSLMQGDVSQIRDDLAALASRGVTEVFLDLNFHPSVGSPDADRSAAEELAERVFEALAPDELA